MRNILNIFLFFVLISLMGCASKITRYGYTLQDIPDRNKCLGYHIAIKKDFVYNKEEVESLGEIKAGDSGVSIDCSEGYVLNLFRQEACALKADLINIIYERNIDLWSSCYRARAQFLRLKDRGKVKLLDSDAQYR